MRVSLTDRRSQCRFGAGRRRSGVSPTLEAVVKQIEMTCVPGRLINHVYEDPPKVDRCDSERRNRGNLFERLTSLDGIAAALACRGVQLEDAFGCVATR